MEREKKGEKVPSSLLRWLSLLLAIAVWQVAAMLLSEELILVSPFRVLLRLLTIWQEDGFFGTVLLSFSRILLGFLLAVLLGSVLAFLAGRFSFLEILLHPYVAVVKAVPVASFIVLAYVWLSSAYISSFITFLIVFPTVYTGLLTGIHAQDKRMEEMADVFDVSPLRRLISVRLPQLEPYILSAASLSAGLAWKSGVAAEIIAVPGSSIGEMIYYANLWLKSVDLYAWTVILVLLSVLFERAFVGLLKLAFRGIERI